MTTQATTKISTHYQPGVSPRRIVLRRDNTSNRANRDHGRYVLSEVLDGVDQWVQRYPTLETAADAAAALGYTELLACRPGDSETAPDPLQGYSPADIVVGPAGQTLADAAASEVAGDGPEPIDGPARYRARAPEVDLVLAIMRSAVGYPVVGYPIERSAALRSGHQVSIHLEFGGAVRGGSAALDLARQSSSVLRVALTAAGYTVWVPEPHHDSGGWCLDVYVSGGPVRS